MKKTQIQLVIIFSVLAMIGSVSIQYYWIRELYKQNHFLFEQNINRALQYAIHQIQRQEDMHTLNRFYKSPSHFFQNNVDDHLSAFFEESNNKFTHKTEVIVHSSSNEELESMLIINDTNQIQVFNSEHNYQFITEEGFDGNISIKIETDSIIQNFESKADSLIQILEYKTIDLRKDKEKLETTIDQLVWEMDEWTNPFSDSIPFKLIEDILFKTMQEFQLPTDFEFAITQKSDQQKLVFQTEQFDKNRTQLTYSNLLYPDYLIPQQQKLIFQLAHGVLYSKMASPILLSVFFTLILTIGLWLIIRNMIHHRNISQIQNDFINNMTHEFKTPIATISLASDSILNPIILKNEDKVSYFTGMIKKENKRMNRLVEKILQMARLENKEFKLEKQKLCLHEILEVAGENTKIKLNGTGIITLKLKAQKCQIMADQLHITNVIYNLIDNAIKYSEDPRKIQISSFNQKNHLIVQIEDNGHGMNKKELQHIFDRFYRIEAGNVHNTKGYGLGLTYVKAVIEKHNGQISVKSEIDKGSIFEIKLPIA